MWVSNLSRTPFLILFIVLGAIGVSSATALMMVTVSGNFTVTGDTTLQGDAHVAPGKSLFVDTIEPESESFVNVPGDFNVAGFANFENNIQLVNSLVFCTDNPSIGTPFDCLFGSMIVAETVTSNEIANDAVGSSEIATNAVGSLEIQAGAVGTSEIADGTITGVDVGTPLVLTGDITADTYFDNGNTQTGINAIALGGIGNTASGIYSTVGGGIDNIAGPGLGSTVGGGTGNNASVDSSTIGGGGGNTASGGWSTVGGGIGNTASGQRSIVAGGQDNIAMGQHSTVGGGNNNKATDIRATVGGGNTNLASGDASTIGGGDFNLASGDRSTIPGGRGNIADGTGSFAAGNFAHANHPGSFVWADSNDVQFESTADDQFSIKAAGGVRVVGDITCTNCFEVTLERLRIVVPAMGSINAVLDCTDQTATVTGFYIDDRSNGSSPANIVGDSVSITPDGNTLTLTMDTKGSSEDTINIYYICLRI